MSHTTGKDKNMKKLKKKDFTEIFAVAIVVAELVGLYWLMTKLPAIYAMLH